MSILPEPGDEILKEPALICRRVYKAPVAIGQATEIIVAAFVALGDEFARIARRFADR